MRRSFPAAKIFALMSRRNTVLKSAASSCVRGGTSRVLVRPGADAFGITAMPQEAVVETQVSAKLIPCLARLPKTETRFADVGDVTSPATQPRPNGYVLARPRDAESRRCECRDKSFVPEDRVWASGYVPSKRHQKILGPPASPSRVFGVYEQQPFGIRRDIRGASIIRHCSNRLMLLGDLNAWRDRSGNVRSCGS